MNLFTMTVMMPIAARTIPKYIQAIAEARPNSQLLFSERIRPITIFIGFVNVSMTVKMMFASMNGLTYGKVIFQKYSQAVAPSI